MGSMGDEAPQPGPVEQEEVDLLPAHDLEDLDAEDAETARLSRRFVAGIVLIVLSLVLGKLVLIPLLLFPESGAWRIGSFIAYLATWVLVIPGLALAGMEGYRLSRRLYKEYRRRALVRVRDGGRRAAHGAVKVVKRPVQDARKVARGTVKLVKKPVEGGRKVARGTVELVKRPLEARRKRDEED